MFSSTGILCDILYLAESIPLAYLWCLCLTVWCEVQSVVPVAYFYNIVEALVANNYTRNKDIKGAPYDFRRAPSK